MNINEDLAQKRMNPITIFYFDADLTLEPISRKDSFFYYEILSSKSDLYVKEEPSNSIPELKLNQADNINSKKQALRNLVESAAAPYLNSDIT